ncbi:MAG: hypothetical protein ACLF0G_12665 [Candidatus Brocadiia bacterium]
MTRGLRPHGRLPLGLLLAAALALIGLGCSSESATDGSTSGGGDSGAGGRSGASETGPRVFGPPAARIRIEAEDGEIKQNDKIMRVVEDPEASGGKCVFIPGEVGKPEDEKFARAVYRFTVEKEDFYVFWCRRKWLDQCGDTLAVRFDGVGQPHKDAYLFGSDDSSKPPRWGWSTVKVEGKTKQFFLSAGEHVMEILNREDGPRFDVMLLINDKDYVAYGLEEE